MHPRGILHGPCTISNARQSRASRDDGAGNGQDAGTVRPCRCSLKTRVFQRRLQTRLAETQSNTAEQKGRTSLSGSAGMLQPLMLTETRFSCLHAQEIIPPTDPVNRQFLDLVRKLLTFDPSQRITVREALGHPYFNMQIPHEFPL